MPEWTIPMEYLNDKEELAQYKDAALFEAQVCAYMATMDYEDVPCAHGMKLFCPKPPFAGKGCGSWCRLREARIAVEKIIEVDSLRQQSEWLSDRLGETETPGEKYDTFRRKLDNLRNLEDFCVRCGRCANLGDDDWSPEENCTLSWREAFRIKYPRLPEKEVIDKMATLVSASLGSPCNYCPGRKKGEIVDYEEGKTWCAYQDDNYDCPFSWADAARVAVEGLSLADKKKFA